MKFTDLRVWQSAREFVKSVYATFGNLKDYWFKDQICKAALDIINNISETQGRSGDQQLNYFLNAALGSANKLKSMLYVWQDLSYINQEQFDELAKQWDYITAMLAKFKKTVTSEKHTPAEENGNESQ